MRVVCALLLFAGPALPAFPISLTMWPDSSGPVFVGERVIWDAVADGAAGEVWYRYRIRAPLESRYRTIRDFSPTTYVVWTPVATEGTYEIEVSALDRATGEIESAVTDYQVASRVENEPVISGTVNELVFLYSAPPCPEGARTRVELTSPEGSKQYTRWMACTPGQSTNVYLAGMRPETQYRVRGQTEAAGGFDSFGPWLTLTTGALKITPAASRSILSTEQSPQQGFLLQSKPFDVTTAIDLEGNVVWYTIGPFRYLTRPKTGGYFVVINDEPTGGDADQRLRLIDLAGNTVWETNAGAVNLQLERMGLSGRMTSFHHEAEVLSDGRILVLAGTERLLTDVQGPGTVDVVGDMILVLSPDLEVQWAWDAFDHMDPSRRAVLGEVCRQGTGGCPAFRLAAVANDWLHGNALQLTPDGNILYSARHQDQVIKIDYDNGRGSGNILWRMGKDGDFSIASDDPWPWFSHQHDANFTSSDMMTVFDNGNTRQREDDAAESRGQVFRVDEEHRTVTPILNINLGAYSTALGSAQLLENGNWHFDLGWGPNATSQAIEVTPDGAVVSRVQTDTQQYRSFRMRSMYSQ